MPTTRSKKAKIYDGTSVDVDTDNRQSVGKKASPKKAKPSPKKVCKATLFLQFFLRNKRGSTDSTVKADVSPNAFRRTHASSISVTSAGALPPAGRGQATEGWNQAEAGPEGGFR